MDRKIMYPDYKYRKVDGKNPKHEDEDGMRVVVKIVMISRPLASSVSRQVISCEDNGLPFL